MEPIKEEVPVLLKRENRVIDDSFLITFAQLYNKLKAKGMLPTEITKTVMEMIDCSNSRYYAYLRMARARGFIKDSYDQNMEQYLERMRAKWDKLKQAAGATQRIRVANPSWCRYILDIFTKRKK